MANFYGEALKTVAQTCPNCNNSMRESTHLCVQCGYNFDSGKTLHTTALIEKPPKDKSASPADNSMLIGLGVFGVLMGLGVGARMRSDLFLPLELAGILLATPLWIWVLIEAFRQGIGRGLASLFIPFYMLYWLNSHCDKPVAKAVGTAAYAAPVILRVLSATDILSAPSFDLPE